MEIRAGFMRIVLLCLFAIPGLSLSQTTLDRYSNPLDVSIADPHVLKDNGVYYLYGTSYDWNGFSVFSSTDMVNWTRRGLCWQMTSSSWGQRDFWAPEVIKAGSTYYLYYTAFNPATNRRNISVASSSSPLGPFTDVTTPILPATQSYIDGHPYYDTASDKYYLFAVREDTAPSKIVVIELTNPPTRMTGGITEVMTVSQRWEGGWVEAPFVVRHENTFYMMYSARAYWENEYAVGYATASSLRGPWAKSPTNPILKQSATVSGPGHNGVVLSPDNSELFVVYHTHLTFAGGGSRQLAIDRLAFSNHPTTGQPDRLSMQAGGPTTTLQPYPSGAAPRNVGASDDFQATTLNRNRWNTVREAGTHWRLDNGQLFIDTQDGDLNGDRVDAQNIFLQYAPAGDFTIETLLTFSPVANFEQAFLLLWQDQSNYVKLASVFAGRAALEIATEKNGEYSGVTVANPWGSVIRLKIERRGDKCYFFAGGPNDQNWSPVGSPVTFATHQPQVGVGAFSPGSGARRIARFNYFNLIAPTSVQDWQLY